MMDIRRAEFKEEEGIRMVDLDKYIRSKKLKMKTENILLKKLTGRFVPPIDQATEKLTIKLVRDYSKMLGTKIITLHIHKDGLSLEEVKYIQEELVKDGSTKAIMTCARMMLEVTLSEEAATYIYETTPRLEP